MKPFEGLFGNNVELRIIEFLLPFHGVEFNITDLAKEAGVSRTTADKVVKKFVEWDFMKISRTDNTIKFYQVNEDSPIYRNFVDLDNKILELMLSDEELFEIHEEMHSQGLFKNKPTPSKPAESLFPLSLESSFDWQSYIQHPSPTEAISQYRYMSEYQSACDNLHGGQGNAAN